ncbi:MAG: NYN domain-containing protein [Kiritimatiellae bacterium]|nr:NYN domain-containing protein [Kiritimatiellia bacterium]MDD5521500.1 NYN domain-containing protein [Kiritimatiellia bacterium]
MKKRIAIIDGYNVIHRITELKKRLDISLASARKGLIEYCLRYLSVKGDFSEFLIVFDGDSSVMPWTGMGGYGVRVIFTPTKEDADDRILALVRDCGRETDCIVISSDNYVSGNSKRHGAETMTVSSFVRLVTAARKGQLRQNDTNHSRGLSPVQERQINESLKKEWGLK